MTSSGLVFESRLVRFPRPENSRRAASLVAIGMHIFPVSSLAHSGL
jgi:hypothetical protein